MRTYTRLMIRLDLLNIQTSCWKTNNVQMISSSDVLFHFCFPYISLFYNISGPKGFWPTTASKLYPASRSAATPFWRSCQYNNTIKAQNIRWNNKNFWRHFIQPPPLSLSLSFLLCSVHILFVVSLCYYYFRSQFGRLPSKSIALYSFQTLALSLTHTYTVKTNSFFSLSLFFHIRFTRIR